MYKSRATLIPHIHAAYQDTDLVIITWGGGPGNMGFCLKQIRKCLRF